MARHYSNRTSNAAPRCLALVLLALLIVIQYPLWYGKGSERNLQELRVQLAMQKQANESLQAELDEMESEADSLRTGKDALESRARQGLNMIRENEVLFRLNDQN